MKGDSIPSYDLINWQRYTDGQIQFVTVGLYVGTKDAGNELIIDKDTIKWTGQRKEARCIFVELKCHLLKYYRQHLP